MPLSGSGRNLHSDGKLDVAALCARRCVLDLGDVERLGRWSRANGTLGPRR